MDLYVFLLLAVLGTDSKAIDGSWTEFCPVNCTCDYIYKEVACSGRYNIPNIFPTGVRSLQMTRGQLILLGPDSFNHKDLDQLEKLKLEKNSIAKIDKNAFATLKNLTIIDLSNNHLTYVHPETFQYNTKLAILKLSLNPLSLYGHSRFLVSPSIKYLDLQGCNVDSVSTETVSSLPRLSFLDLSNNPLASCNEELKSLGITVRFDDHLCEVTSDVGSLSTTCSTELVDELDAIIPENIRVLDQESDAEYGRDVESSSTENYASNDNSSQNDTDAKPISVDCGLSKTYDISSATMIAIYVVVLIIALALGFFIGLFIQRGGRGARYLSFGDSNMDMQKDDVPVSESAESSAPATTQSPVQSPLPVPASRQSVVPEQSPVPVAASVQTPEEGTAPETSQAVDKLGSPVQGPSSVQVPAPAPAPTSYQEKDKIEI